MSTWTDGVRMETWMLMGTMLGAAAMVVMPDLALAAVGGGAVGQWDPMAKSINSTQGTPAQALTTGMGMGAAFRVMMGDVGPGIVGVGCVGGGGWLATHCADAFNAWGVTGAIAKVQAIAAVMLS